MDESTLEKYREAGRIAADARKYGLTLIKENALLLDVATLIEARILEEGGGLAFPVNISVNEVSAHYTPRVNDDMVFNRGDVVKLDVGVHIDGYIADTAATIEVGTNRYSALIRASDEALRNAIDTLNKHASLNDVGQVIEETITSYGYKPINNLTGHSLRRYVLHAGVSVPNIRDSNMVMIKPKVDDVLAVEPFATDGAGYVVSGEGGNIFLYQGSLRSRFIHDKKLKRSAIILKDKFGTLPFAERWCSTLLPSHGLVLKHLSAYGLLRHYPMLIEKGRGVVSQAEHTVIITKDGCLVTT
ncbi:MAG: type II methionyl aminopeptidase [Candidatus Thermoplasmatota archaeon]